MEDNNFQNPPLFTACMQGNLEAVQLLLSSPDYITDINEDRGYFRWDADVNFYATPLWAAAAGGHLEIVRYLIESGANINATGLYHDYESTPLNFACQFGSIQVVKLLVESGADISLRDSQNETCLMLASQAISAEVCQYLIENGADVLATEVHDGNTALHYACDDRDDNEVHLFEEELLNVARILIENGANVNARNNDGSTSLMLSYHSPKLCDYLLNQGAHVNLVDFFASMSVLNRALFECKYETLIVLIMHEADTSGLGSGFIDWLHTMLNDGPEDADELFTESEKSMKYQGVASGIELIGSAILFKSNDINETLRLWKVACDLRADEDVNITKDVNESNASIYQSRSEFTCGEEIPDSKDEEAIYEQSLMITERVLGKNHHFFHDFLHERALHFENNRKFEKAIDYCKYAFQCGDTNGLQVKPLALRHLAINVIVKHDLDYKDKLPPGLKDPCPWKDQVFSNLQVESQSSRSSV